MKGKALIAAALAFLIAGTAAAQEQPAMPPTDTGAAASAVDMPRDPFWPVGYRPKPKTPENSEDQFPESRVQWPELALKGITRAGEGSYLAILEGIGVVEAGDVVSIQRDDLVYRWRINEIKERGVAHTRLDVRPAREMPTQE
jgi:hypothetical protein